MHVGMSAVFQGFGGTLSDQEVWAADLALADLAEPLGYESIWSVEHHFTNYTMCPDVLQFLTYMAGRTTKVQLGSMVLVLPWHDPVRAAEQIIMLDHMSNGRLILGLGRGTGKVEFDGFRVEMAPGPPAVQGVGRGHPHRPRDRRDGVRRRVRPPAPHRAAPGAVQVVQGPHLLGHHLARVGRDHGQARHRRARRAAEAVAPRRGGDGDTTARPTGRPTARSRRRRSSPAGPTSTRTPTGPRRTPAAGWPATGTRSSSHYEFDKPHLKSTPGYEFHGQMYDRLTAPGGPEKMTEFYIGLQPWGTPEQVFEKMRTFCDLVGGDSYVGVFRYGGMPPAEAEKSACGCSPRRSCPSCRRSGPPSSAWSTSGADAAPLGADSLARTSVSLGRRRCGAT